MFNSLRFRLFLSHLALVVLTLGIIVGALLVLLLATPISTLQTYRQITDVARASSAYLASSGAQSIDSRLLEVAQTNEVRTLRLSPDGLAIFDSAGEFAAGQAVTIRLNREPQGNNAQLTRGAFTDSQGREWLTVSLSRAAVGSIVFATPRPRNRIAAALGENLTTPLAQSALIGTVLSIVFASLISGWISRPLGQTAAAARAIAAGDYNQQAPEQGPTEVRDLARQFNQMSNQARQARQTQRDFLANVTHELKTPLTSIKGFSQAIIDGVATRPAEAAQVIFEEAERMLRLAEDLLDLAKLESGQINLLHEPIDVGALLENVKTRFALRAADQQVTLAYELVSLPPIMSDPDRLAQIFTNLIDNALKHTPAGGRVSIEARQSNDSLEVVVQDTGNGIPAEDINRIFERFFQSDKSRARSEGRSAGLGLTICKETAQALGGDIRAESPPGQGARFVVTLPVISSGHPARIRIS